MHKSLEGTERAAFNPPFGRGQNLIRPQTCSWAFRCAPHHHQNQGNINDKCLWKFPSFGPHTSKGKEQLSPFQGEKTKEKHRGKKIGTQKTVRKPKTERRRKFCFERLSYIQFLRTSLFPGIKTQWRLKRPASDLFPYEAVSGPDSTESQARFEAPAKGAGYVSRANEVPHPVP